jgi:hypothetical protein
VEAEHRLLVLNRFAHTAISKEDQQSSDQEREEQGIDGDGCICGHERKTFGRPMRIRAELQFAA